MATAFDLLTGLGIDTSRAAAGQTSAVRCPECSHTRRKANARPLSLTIDSDGRGAVWLCHHCGFTGSVHEWQAQRNHQTKPKAKPKPKPAPAPARYIPGELVTKSTDTARVMQTPLARWFVSRAAGLGIDPEAVRDVLALFRVGAGKQSATVWFTADWKGVRSAKVMHYGADGKRTKAAGAVYTPEGYRTTDGYSPVAFGLHQTQLNPSRILAVESEKTALVGSLLYPDGCWLATGGKAAYARLACPEMQGRMVTVLLDSGEPGNPELASRIVEQLRAGGLAGVRVVDPFPEATVPGFDLADWFDLGCPEPGPDFGNMLAEWRSPNFARWANENTGGGMLPLADTRSPRGEPLNREYEAFSEGLSLCEMLATPDGAIALAQMAADNPAILKLAQVLECTEVRAGDSDTGPLEPFALHVA